jgi:hypothetical protein
LQSALETDKQALQRQTELFKTELAQVQKRLERSEEGAYRFRLERLTPFLEALNRSVVHSYSAVVGLEVFSELRGHSQAFVQHGAGALSEWLKAAQEVSDHRIQVLLSVDAESVMPLVTELQKLVHLQKQILEARQAYLAQQATLAQVSQVHSAYVRVGYKLMIDIKNAISRSGDEQRKLTEQELADLAEAVVGPLEKSSVISVPYGTTHRNSWIAIWRLNASMLQYEGIESGYSEFERSLIEFAKVVNEIPSVLEAKMMRVGSDQDEERTYALGVSFCDKKTLTDYQENLLPGLRLQTKLLWKGFVAPIEIMVD